MEAAYKPAFIAPSSPIATLPTGIPFGICTIDNKLSNPFNLRLSTGTPITGIVVNDAIIPGKCAEPPAPAILKKINEKKKVLPKPEINQLIQHRETEKKFLNNNNITTTKYVTVKNEKDLSKNVDLLPGLLKTTTLGYDGKCQYKLNTVDDITKEIDFTKEYILEKLIHLKKEISVVITRYDQNSYEIYDPIENVHEDQILKYSTIPSDISDEIQTKSIESAKQVVEKLDYIGTLCVEFFIDTDDNLYANEIAPRVHNSGHLTMNSHNISQFENHVRAVCGLEKIKTKKLYNAKMINLIGDDITPYRNKTFKDNEFFYDYLKTEIKNKRKMGHITIIEK